MQMLITECVDKLVAAQTTGTQQERVDKAIKVMLDSNVISQLQADALASLYYEGIKLENINQDKHTRRLLDSEIESARSEMKKDEDRRTRD